MIPLVGRIWLSVCDIARNTGASYWLLASIAAECFGAALWWRLQQHLTSQEPFRNPSAQTMSGDG